MTVKSPINEKTPEKITVHAETELSPVEASQQDIYLSKPEIEEYFGGEISQLAFVPDESEPSGWMIKGKYCLIMNHYDPDLWDILICNPDDMGKGLSTRKVKNIANVIDWRDGKYRMMDGEADGIVVGKQTILDNLKALGIRRKRKMSDKQKADGAKRLADYRKSQVVDSLDKAMPGFRGLI